MSIVYLLLVTGSIKKGGIRLSRMTKGYFFSYRDYVLDHAQHPAFSKKPKNKFVFYVLQGMASFKKTNSVNVGEIRTSYDEIADETGYEPHQVRWCIASLIKHKMLVKKNSHQGLHLSIPSVAKDSRKLSANSQGDSQGDSQQRDTGYDKDNESLDSVQNERLSGLMTGIQSLISHLSVTVRNNELRSNSNNDQKIKLSDESPTDRLTDRQTEQRSRDYNEPSFPQGQQDVRTPFDDPTPGQSVSQLVGEKNGNLNIDNSGLSDNVRNLLENSGIFRNEELLAISVKSKQLGICDAELALMANEMYGKYKENKVHMPYKYFLGCLRNHHKESVAVATEQTKPPTPEIKQENKPKKNQEFTDFCWNDRLKKGKFPLEFEFSIDGYPSDYNENPEKYREVGENELR